LNVLVRILKELIRKSADVDEAIAFRAELNEHAKVGNTQHQRLQQIAGLERIKSRHFANQRNGISEISFVSKWKL
jgi:hypothetical protein